VNPKLNRGKNKVPMNHDHRHSGNDEWWALATIHTKGERVRARRTKQAALFFIRSLFQTKQIAFELL